MCSPFRASAQAARPAGAVIPADDPHIRYTGRVDRSVPGRVTFDWPAVTIEAAFQGTSCALRLVDGANDYDVRIDGGDPLHLATTEDTLYTVAAGLADTVHTLRVTRRTEASFGEAVFLGLVLDAGRRLVPLPPPPARRIEFIGDSITCGYGNEGETPTCPFTRATENSTRSYAAMTARALGAELVMEAYSGKGLVRNYGDSLTVSARPMPSYFDQTKANDPATRWDFDRWTPHAVVINLGTNDFSTEPHPSQQAFTGGYAALIARVRRHYPEAHIFCVAGPLMKPPAARYIREVVRREREERGDARVHFVPIEDTLERPADFGCDWHPNVAGHRKIADQLVPALAPVMGW